MGTSIYAVNADPIAANNFGVSARTEVQGSVIAGSITTTLIPTNLANPLNNSYVGRTILFTSGVLTGTAAGITIYNGTTNVLTVTPLPTAPSPGDTFIIV